MYNDNQAPLTPYGPEIQTNNINPEPKKNRRFIIIGAIAIIVIICGIVTSLIIANSGSEDDYLSNRVVLSESLTNEFYDLYTSEAMQDIDEAIEEYFSPIYQDGETLSLDEKQQLESGDYQYSLITSHGNKHMMLIVDEGSTVTIEIDGSFKKTYTNEPHPDD